MTYSYDFRHTGHGAVYGHWTDIVGQVLLARRATYDFTKFWYIDPRMSQTRIALLATL
jgi:hypothetical protein